MRVLLVTNDYPPKPGGIQQYLGNLVSHYPGEIRVAGPAHAGAPDDPQVIRGSRAFMWPGRATRAWVREQIAGFESDVVVFGAPHPLALMGPRLRRETGVPFVVMTHGAEITVPATVPLVRGVLRRTLSKADHVFAVSRYTARQVERLAGRPVAVLGAGVDLAVFHPAGERGVQPITIGCVSRFVPRKGHARVIAAAEAVAATGRDVRVLLVGRGRLEARLRRRAATSTVPVRVEVDVPWERLPDLYREIDVFAMPARSRWLGLEAEGLGIVYLEASATGIPVLAGSSGGSPETVVPGETGFVATSVGQLVEALDLAIERREVLGAGARHLAEREYSWDAVIERFQEGLMAAVGGRER